jgi:hypothetical protein
MIAATMSAPAAERTDMPRRLNSPPQSRRSASTVQGAAAAALATRNLSSATKQYRLGGLVFDLPFRTRKMLRDSRGISAPSSTSISAWCTRFGFGPHLPIP